MITEKFWVTDRSVIIDVQTPGFKGNHQYKISITYKSTGNIFQCDAIRDKGYILYFI